MSLPKLIAEYAELLDLGEWKIRAVYAAPGQIRAGNVGQLEWAQTKRSNRALVLLDPSPNHDHEITAVHELVHLVMLPCPPDSPAQEAAQEFVIDQVAKALVAARRAVRS